jgi:hypothetical protein
MASYANYELGSASPCTAQDVGRMTQVPRFRPYCKAFSFW